MPPLNQHTLPVCILLVNTVAAPISPAVHEGTTAPVAPIGIDVTAVGPPQSFCAKTRVIPSFQLERHPQHRSRGCPQREKRARTALDARCLGACPTEHGDASRQFGIALLMCCRCSPETPRTHRGCSGRSRLSERQDIGGFERGAMRARTSSERPRPRCGLAVSTARVAPRGGDSVVLALGRPATACVDP